MGGSRNHVAAAHSGLVTCTGSGCLPGRDDSSAEDGYSPDETNYCKCIIGLLLYETGINANSQEAFSTYVYEV